MANLFEATIKALKSRERNLWTISDSLLTEWSPPKDRQNLKAEDYSCTPETSEPDGHEDPTGGTCCLYQAQRVAGLVPLPYNTARLYRAVSEFWPIADRIDGVNYTAHRAAMRAGKGVTGRQATKAGINAIKTALNGVDQDPTRVTEAAVKAVVGAPGRGAGKGRKPGTLSIASLVKALDAVRVNEHLAPLSDKDLGVYVKTLESALSQAQSHQGTRARRGGGKSAKATKAAKTATKAQPSSARG